MNRLLLLDVVLPGFRKPIVVDQLLRILQPGQESPTPLTFDPRRELAARNLGVRQPAILCSTRRADPLTNTEIPEIAIRHAEQIRELCYGTRHRKRRARLRGHELRRRIEIAHHGAAIVIRDVLVVRDEASNRIFDVLDTGDDGRLQIFELLVLAGDVINDPVDVALLVELVGRHADLLRALLPRQVVLTSNVRKALRVDRVENAITDRKDQV